MKVDGKLLSQQKQEKYRNKQQQKLEAAAKLKERNDWLDRHSNFVASIEYNDAIILKELARTDAIAKNETVGEKSIKRPKIEPSPNSQRENFLQELLVYIKPYMDLKENSKEDISINIDSSLEAHINDGIRYFIAEGTETVRMIIEQSCSEKRAEKGLLPIKIHSVFVKPSTFFEDPVNIRQTIMQSFPHCFKQNGIENNQNSLPFHIIVSTEKAMTHAVGFPVARGAMLCGMVPNYSKEWLDAHLEKRIRRKSNIRLLALDNISDTANLGSLIRSCTAFGITAVLLSEDSCDAFYRRCVRVSMGHVLNIMSVRVQSMSAALKDFKERYGIVSYAAVIDKNADMVLETVDRGDINKNWCCVLGNEGNGLRNEVISMCNHTIRIEMDDEVDSLSVGVAGGILLHGLRE
eukprot:CAMPEP_0176481050 /NCGR_PEP_ID=MMETSP0200_2-20121128/2607_1 /TAXON_ID=947934 /ORGANISM="Chaetoceros sp., Strain GSL56" /LENGTH=406 /DNA_ID=CAMNT_0017877217 /DNA_START=70 /DNA_END=1287 /DNA_ORIENTATION=+